MSDELHLITDSKANGGTSSMPPSACRRPRLLFLIVPLAQFLAGFEMRHELLRHVHPLARFRIAADARRPVIQPETPEAADLDALPFDQTLRQKGNASDRKSTRLNSSHGSISYAVFCFKKKKKT